MKLSIELEGALPMSLRKNRGSTGHWDRRRDAERMRGDAALLWRDAIAVRRQWERSWPERFPRAELPLKACIITITQFWCGKPLDHAGLASATAPACDALMDADIIEDDSPALGVIRDYRLRYERVKHRDQAKVRIEVETA